MTDIAIAQEQARTLWVQRWSDGPAAMPDFGSYSLHRSPGDVAAYARERESYAPDSTPLGDIYPWECTDMKIIARVLQSRCGLDWYGRPPENANTIGMYPTDAPPEVVHQPGALVVGDAIGPVIGVPELVEQSAPVAVAPVPVPEPAAPLPAPVIRSPRCEAAVLASNCEGSYRRAGTVTYCRFHYEEKYPPRPKTERVVDPPPNLNKGGFMYEVHVTKANGAFTRTSFNDELDVIKYLSEKAAAGEGSEVKLYEKITSHSDRTTSWHPLEWKLEVIYQPVIVRAKGAKGANGAGSSKSVAPAEVMKRAHANVMQGAKPRPALADKTLAEWRALLTTGTPIDCSIALDGAVYRLIERAATNGSTLNTLHAELKKDMGKMSRPGRIAAALHRLLFDYKVITKGVRKTGPGVLYYLKGKSPAPGDILSLTSPAMPTAPIVLAQRYGGVVVQPAHERYILQLLRAAGKKGMLAHDLISVVGDTMTKDERLAVLAKCRADGRVVRTGRTKSVRYFVA